MVVLLILLSFFAFSYAKPKAEEVVRDFYLKVVYNTDYRTCTKILLNHVIFKPFLNGEYRLNRSQTQDLCRQMSSNPRKLPYRLKKLEVKITRAKRKGFNLAIVSFIKEDGRIAMSSSLYIKQDKNNVFIIW